MTGATRAMERPPSSASAHKRALSVKHPDAKSPISTVISLFVKNIRLLNLDLLPDWPVITPASFSNQDARTRIRSAEWALYQLFRAYDQPTAAEKLQPFFPPLEPLQSINLRAALYRCLNELKKNGVLGRETVLRKSMLDDCQGDKFWELCLSFSTVVLRKVTVDKHNNKYGRPLSERLGTAQGLSRSQCDSMLPLSIAHRAALSKVLFEKQRKRRTFVKLFDVLTEKEEELQERKSQSKPKGNRSQKVAMAQEVLDKSWVGSDELRDALTNGDEAAGTDSMLTKPFDAVWEANERERLFPADSAEVGMLEDLENRARQQKQRLQKWQSFHEDLICSRPPSSRDSNDSGKAFKLSFDKHQNLTLRDMEDSPPPTSSPTRHEKHDSVMKYDEILTAMREELRKKSGVVAAAQAPVREPEPEPTPRSRPMSFRQPPVSEERFTESHHRSNSQTAVPMRPGFGQRVPSRSSRSYQQPKIISQREIIPLKSEIFSPLKTTRRTSTSPSSSGRMSVLASPVEEPFPDGQIDNVVSAPRQDGDVTAGADPLGLSISRSNTPIRNHSGTSTPRSTRSGSGNPDSAIEIPSKRSATGAAGRNLDGTGITMRPSLADRTRMSMAFRSSDDITSESEASNHARHETADSASTSASNSAFAEPTPLERKLTLHERTRQSISMMPSQNTNSLGSATAVPLKLTARKSSHARSRTSAFPVNPFETPDKAARRRSTFTLEAAGSASNEHLPLEQRRNITPREKLFEQDAEYNSIFKARPKVALSPIVSPQFGGDESQYEDGGEVGMSSPLVGAAVRNGGGGSS